ncbi:MAG: sodium-dependent transporter [Halobacteriota archaeon]
MAVRETWATRVGFILAAVGSAVGLGNVWRFPFQVGAEGGAAFLVVYLVFVAAIGFPAVLVEFVIGRQTKRNPVGALESLGGTRWRYVGWIFIVTGFVLLSYYSVVAGWFLQYFFLGLLEGYTATTAAELDVAFEAASSGLSAFVAHTVFMAAVVGIVVAGIRSGIETAVTVLVPGIVAVLVGLAIYGAVAIPHAPEAYAYYLQPNFGVILAEWRTILPAAAGQAFFTLSLGMGVMITYASYLGEDRNLATDASMIVGLDTFIAILVGFVVFPFIFQAGADPDEIGADAIFVSLAQAFATIPAGRLLGVVFFGMVVLAALSSAISILEVLASYLIDELGWRRPIAAGACGVAVFVLGIPVTIDLRFLQLFDGFAEGVLLVLGALLVVVFVGWVVPDQALAELKTGIRNPGVLGDVWLWLVRIPILIVLLVSLYFGVSGYVEFLIETGDSLLPG